jgi:hypothetical protein
MIVHSIAISTVHNPMFKLTIVGQLTASPHETVIFMDIVIRNVHERSYSEKKSLEQYDHNCKPSLLRFIISKSI